MPKFATHLLLTFSLILPAQEKSSNAAVDKALKLKGEMVKNYMSENNESYKAYADSLLSWSLANDLKEFEIQALMNQGIYYVNTNAYEKALIKYLDALEESNRLDSLKPKISVLVNLANLYNILEDYEKAASAANKTIELCREIKGTEKIQIASYNALAISQRNLNKPEAALGYTLKTKEIAEKIKDTIPLITALNNIGDNYIHLKRFTEAIDASKESLKLNGKIGYEKAKSLSYLNLGLAQLRLGNTNEAVENLTKCLKIAHGQNLKEREMHCQKILAEAYEKQGQLQKSLEAQKRYQALKDEEGKEKLKTVKSEYNFKDEKESKALEKVQNSVSTLRKQRKILTSILLITGLLFTVSVFILIYKKKKINQETNRLREEYATLTNRHSALKKEFQQIALRDRDDDHFVKYKKSSLNQDTYKELVDRILEYMEKNKPYTSQHYSPDKMAMDLAISKHHLSEVLNVCFEKNFNTFINIYRVNEAQALFKKPGYQTLKIESIGYEAGFNSKTSFNRAFKKLVGITPSEYREKNAT